MDVNGLDNFTNHKKDDYEKLKKLNPNNKVNKKNIARHLNNISYGGVHGIKLPPLDKPPPIKNINRQLLDKMNELHDLKNKTKGDD